MACLIELIPPVCICGNNIGRLQVKIEDKLRENGGGSSFHQSLHEVFKENGGFVPRMCCSGQISKAQVYIPNTKIDTVYIDNSRGVEAVKTIYKFTPRFPPPEYPQFDE